MAVWMALIALRSSDIRIKVTWIKNTSVTNHYWAECRIHVKSTERLNNPSHWADSLNFAVIVRLSGLFLSIE